jgi:hypothetical protein
MNALQVSTSGCRNRMVAAENPFLGDVDTKFQAVLQGHFGPSIQGVSRRTDEFFGG